MQQVSKQLINGLPRRIALMLLDCGLIVLCYWLAVMLRFDSGDAYRRVEILRAMACTAALLNTDFLKNVSNRVADSRGRSKRKVNNTKIDAKPS